MPRAARLDIPDLLQHVIIRGVDRCDIFRDDADRKRFLVNLSNLLVQTGGLPEGFQGRCLLVD